MRRPTGSPGAARALPSPSGGTLSLIRADVARWHDIYGTYLYVLHPGSLAVLTYRLAHGLSDRGPLGVFAARALSFFNIIVTGADFHARAVVGPGLFVPHTQGTLFGEHTRAGKNLTLYTGALIGQSNQEGTGVTIGDNVTFWSKASAFGSITIGDNVQIGAHALVMCDVPADHQALGVPATVRPRRPAAD